MRWPTDIKLREQAGRLQLAGRVLLAGCRHVGERAWWSAKAGRRRFGHDISGIVEAQESSRLEAGNLAGRLGEEKEFLLTMVHGMETEFLATGGGLMHLAQQLNEIQKQCQSLTDLTLGRTQDAAVQFAFQLLKKAEDLVIASYDQYDHVFATFSELQQTLAGLARQHDDLMRVLLPLNFITISFRIEASRHPLEVQQSFFTLADTVTRTVSEVRSTMERQFEELAVSERIARILMEQISTSIRLHRKSVAATLETSRQQLSALSEALISAGAGATDLAHLNKAVNRHIGVIVMAQQCQDIIRQRIEHVGEAMEEMRAHLGETQTITSAPDAETRPFVFRAGQIQLRQTQNVFDQLTSAADSIKGGIQNLRSEVGGAAEVAIKVAGTTLDAKAASQCQAGIGEILAITQQAVQRIADILGAFAPLQASFVDCTSKATALASDVRHAGLNAQVFAIHAPNGATLEVLAGRVRTISEEVIHQVGQMGTALNATNEKVNQLRERLTEFQQLARVEQEVLTDESALSRKKLSDLENAIPALMRSITRQQGTFAQSVEEVLANVRFPVTVVEASSRSLGFFQELVTWGSAGGAKLRTDSAASRKIDLLLSKYTMESERVAHATALQPGMTTEDASADSSIEMFDSFEPASPEAAGGRIAPAMELAAGEIKPAVPAPLVASQKPTASEPLDDNVELF